MSFLIKWMQDEKLRATLLLGSVFFYTVSRELVRNEKRRLKLAKKRHAPIAPSVKRKLKPLIQRPVRILIDSNWSTFVNFFCLKWVVDSIPLPYGLIIPGVLVTSAIYNCVSETEVEDEETDKTASCLIQ